MALNRERGLTIVLVTHETDIAAYADRVVTMRDGKIVSDKRDREPQRRARPGGACRRPSIAVKAAARQARPAHGGFRNR